MDSVAAAGLTLTTIGVAGSVFGQVLPPAHAIADKPSTAEGTAYVRSRATQAAVLVGCVGAGAALLTRSPWPLIGSGAVAGWLWWQYAAAADLDPLWTT